MTSATVDGPRAAAWGNGSSPDAGGSARPPRSGQAEPEQVPAVLPWPMRPPRRVAGIPVGLLVCWQVALLLALVAIGRPAGAVIALGTAAALVVIVTGLRPRGRWVHEWFVLWLRYTFRGQRVPDVRQPPALALLDLAATTETVEDVEIDGDQVAVVSHADGYATALELRTDNLSPYLPLTLAPRHQPDTPVVSVQLLVHATPVVPGTPVATVRSWLAVQVARDPSYQPEELRGALVNAVRRLQRRLRSAQLEAQPADRSRLVEALHTLTRLDHAGPVGPGDNLPLGGERWRTWWTRGVPQESVAVRSWPGSPGPPSPAVFDVLLSPRWPQTVSIAGRRQRLATAHGALQAGEEVLTVEVVVRVSERDRSTLVAAVRQLCDRLRAAGARVERLDGRQLPAFAATTPIGGFLSGYAPAASAYSAPPRRKARRLLTQPALPAAAQPAGRIPPPLHRDAVPAPPPPPLPPPPAPTPPPQLRREPPPGRHDAASARVPPPNLTGRVPPPPAPTGAAPRAVPAPPPPAAPSTSAPQAPQAVPPMPASPAPPPSSVPPSPPPSSPPPSSVPPSPPPSSVPPSPVPPSPVPSTPQPIEIRPLFPARGQAGVPVPPSIPEPQSPVRGQATVPAAPADPARGTASVPEPELRPVGEQGDSWFEPTTSDMPTALRGVATPPPPPVPPSLSPPPHVPVPPQAPPPSDAHGAARAYGASLFTSESRRRSKVEQLMMQVRTPHRSAQVVAVLAGGSGLGTSTTAAGMARILATVRDDYTALLSVETGRVTAATIQEVSRGHAFVVVDLGGHAGEAAPQALSVSTRVVVVTSADKHDAATTRVILDRIHQVKPMLVAGAVVAVVCKTGRQYRRVVKELSEDRTPQATQIIPIPGDPALRAMDELDLTRLAQPTREAYLRLAAAVATPRPAAAGGAPPHAPVPHR